MKQNFNIPNSSTRKFHFTSWNSFTINSPISIHLKLWAEHTRKRGRLKLGHIQMEDRDSHGHSWCTRSMPQIMKIIRYNHFLLPFNSISYNRMLYLLIFTQLFGLAACSCCSCILCRICEHLPHFLWLCDESSVQKRYRRCAREKGSPTIGVGPVKN